MDLSDLKLQYMKAGAVKLYAKPLAENDNSKNQIYFGPGFHALNLFPSEGIHSDFKYRSATFKARLNFSWLLENGATVPAAGAQLILYPQYPEVRFSGFLKGCKEAPSEYLRGREKGRILFLGVTSDAKIIGYVVDRDSRIANEFLGLKIKETAGVFTDLGLHAARQTDESRILLLKELRRINRKGWIESKQLDATGTLKTCNAPQCGGFTLEAELGIVKNSKAEPDFHGWEIKQHAVTDFSRPDSGNAITLMTPEPTGGVYKEKGVEAFIRSYGYPDRNDKPDRLNFGGIFKMDRRNESTSMTLHFAGYDAKTRKITDTGGCIILADDRGDIAASWSFAGLLAHWSRKHTKAVYVPSMKHVEPPPRYKYGHLVRIGEETDALSLLEAMADGFVYYDPGIKLEHASTTPVIKRRSQFRIASKHITRLYKHFETVEV